MSKQVELNKKLLELCKSHNFRDARIALQQTLNDIERYAIVTQKTCSED